MKWKKFSKDQRGSFSYWFWHWMAFNYVAIKTLHWRPSYLFHDIEKPFLMLIYKDYSEVQSIHRSHSRHHLESFKRKNWRAMVIDWECSRYTKEACQRTAVEEIYHLYNEAKISRYTFFKLTRAAINLGLL